MKNAELIARLKEQCDRDAAEHCPAEIIALQAEGIAAIEALEEEVERLTMALHGYQVAIETAEESLKDRVALAMEVDRLSAAGVSHCGHRPPCVECSKYAAPIPQQPAESVHGPVTAIVGCGLDYRPDEHERGEFRNELGVCLEYSDGYRDCFYLSELTAANQAQLARPINCGTGHCSCIECPYEQAQPVCGYDDETGNCTRVNCCKQAQLDPFTPDWSQDSAAAESIREHQAICNLLLKEMRHIAGISTGQVKRVAEQALEAVKQAQPVLRVIPTAQGVFPVWFDGAWRKSVYKYGTDYGTGIALYAAPIPQQPASLLALLTTRSILIRLYEKLGGVIKSSTPISREIEPWPRVSITEESLCDLRKIWESLPKMQEDLMRHIEAAPQPKETK